MQAMDLERSRADSGQSKSGQFRHFSAAVDERIKIPIVGDLRAAQQRGILFQAQGDMAFDLDRAGEVAARWKGNRPASGYAAIVDHLLQCDSVQRRAVAEHAGLGGITKLRSNRHGRESGEEETKGEGSGKRTDRHRTETT